MSKPTQVTIFRKRQVLPARGLNKALQEYGSVGGSIPYKEDGTQDESMTAALGTKTAPFGNAFFKGFNIYTEVEVQGLVDSGKITADDRFVFWDLSSNSLKAWDGSKIIQIGGNGGNMDYLFGNGSDGDVTMVSSGNYDTIKNFKNFTLNAGVTLSVTSPLTPLILCCTGSCFINGTIDLRGKGFPAGQGHGVKGIAPYMISEESGNANIGQVYAKFMGLDFTPIYGSGGSDGLQDSFATGFNGGGRGGTIGGLHTEIGNGGAGGGYLLIFAKKVVVTGSILLDGIDGQGGNGQNYQNTYACGGGGGGGCAGIFYREKNITGSITAKGGAAGTGTSDASNGKPGGAGAVILMAI